MPNGTVHSGCTDPTRATARLVIVRVVVRVRGCVYMCTEGLNGEEISVFKNIWIRVEGTSVTLRLK